MSYYDEYDIDEERASLWAISETGDLESEHWEFHTNEPSDDEIYLEKEEELEREEQELERKEEEECQEMLEELAILRKEADRLNEKISALIFDLTHYNTGSIVTQEIEGYKVSFRSHETYTYSEATNLLAEKLSDARKVERENGTAIKSSKELLRMTKTRQDVVSHYPRSGQKWSKRELDWIEDQLEKKVSIGEISYRLKRSVSSVIKIIHSHLT